MTRGEKRWLILGVLFGALIATSVYGIQQYRQFRFQSSQAETLNTADNAAATPAPSDDPGTMTSVQLTAEEQKSIGVETVEVTRQTIRKEIAAPGKVVEPETGLGTISARISGRIEKLLLNVTGESVRRGDQVALIYSPEIFAAGEEYRLSLENRQRLAASKEADAVVQADELVRASRRRLEIRGLTPQQIEEIASASEKPIEIAVYSPMSGIVTKRNVAEGQYVKEGDALFEIADLSTVWVQADIFESDIPLIRNGQTVKITAPTLAGSLRGVISFLQPAVDPQTRTMPVRIQVSNAQMRLRPGMFVQVSFETSFGSDVVAVPRSAVLDTGKEKVVYVAKDNGIFEKRSIDATTAGDEYYAVTKGVEPGERVVTHGNFMIDSQTRLTGTMTGLFGGSKAFGTEASPSDYTVTFRADPSPPKGGTDGTFHVTVTGPDGKPVNDAQIQMTLVMPAMPAMGMGEMRSSITLTWNGTEYTGTGPVPMAGSWNITVEARRGGQLLAVYRSRFDAK